MLRPALAIGAIALLLILSSCSSTSVDNSFAEGKELFFENKIENAHKKLLNAHANDPDNTEIICYLAEASRRLERMDDALSLANQALALDECNAFAHTILASAYEPLWGQREFSSSDSCWHHALAATECDPTDGNAWLVVWTQAMRRADDERVNQALSALIEHGFFSRPVLEYNRWVLESLPVGAMLITNGDLDTYPALALQYAKGLRPDVAIVNVSLLNTDWYTEYLHGRYGLTLPFPEDQERSVKAYKDGDLLVTAAMQRLDAWQKKSDEGTIQNPIAVATTVYNENLPVGMRDKLTFSGSYSRVEIDAANPESVAQLKEAFDRADLAAYEHPAASEKDRSPVRRVSSDFGARNLTAIGIRLCTALLEEKEKAQAQEYLEVVKGFAKQTGVEDLFSEKFQKLEVDLHG